MNEFFTPEKYKTVHETIWDTYSCLWVMYATEFFYFSGLKAFVIKNYIMSSFSKYNHLIFILITIWSLNYYLFLPSILTILRSENKYISTKTLFMLFCLWIMLQKPFHILYFFLKFFINLSLLTLFTDMSPRFKDK